MYKLLNAGMCLSRGSLSKMLVGGILGKSWTSKSMEKDHLQGHIHGRYHLLYLLLDSGDMVFFFLIPTLLVLCYTLSSKSITLLS